MRACSIGQLGAGSREAPPGEAGERHALAEGRRTPGWGRGVAPDPERGVRTLQKACDAGGARACSNLAAAHFDGHGGVTVDPDKGRPLAERACELGEAHGCDILRRLGGQ